MSAPSMDDEVPSRPMRRAEREVVDRASLDEILQKAPVLALALRADPAPYVVPVCFGFDAGTLYVHGALAGAKIDLLRADPVVGFCAWTGPAIREGGSACDFSMSARSVVGTGRARILEDPEECRFGLDAIMRHYAPGATGTPVYRPQSLSRTAVIAVRIDTLRGKQLGHDAS